MSAQVSLVPYGPAMVGALAAAVGDLQGGDPLAPVTVTAPSVHAATTLRRRLAADGFPLVNVAFTTLSGLARSILAGAPGQADRPALTPLVRRALLQALLADDEGAAAGLADRSAAVRSLEATFDQLALLDEAERRQLAAGSPSAAEVVRLHERFRRRARAFADHREVAAEAAASLEAGRVGAGPEGTVGAVVALLVPPLRADHAVLVDALVRRGRSRALVGVTGEADVDEAAAALAERWAGTLAPAPGVEHPGAGPERTFVRAPDPEEEVRAAVRRVGAALASTPAERIAVVARSAQPYHLLLHERFSAAGIAHHGRSPLSLGQSVAGRALRGLLIDPALPAPTAEAPWGDHGRRWRSRLDERLGGVEPTGWPADERVAWEGVCDLLDELAALEQVSPGATAPEVADVLVDALERPGRPIGRPGRGVFVGAPADLVGAHHDLVVVVGMAEGRHPPRGGGPLDPRRRRALVERRDHLAAVASGTEVVLSTPRADTRAGRAATPARWWLDGLGEVVGRRVHADDVDGLDHPALVDLASFVAGVEGAAVAADDGEQRVAALLAARRSGGPAAAERALAATGPWGSRAVAAWRDRHTGAFSAWTGWVGDLPPGAPGGIGEPRVGSATRFERWATCPYRYFLGNVLGVQAPPDLDVADVISGLDRGSLVHEVLERFHGADLARHPAAGFGPDDLARLAALAAEVGQAYAAEGRTGHQLLWQLEADALLRRLETTLVADAAHRLERGVSPVAVEHHFGGDDDGSPPVEVDLGGGRRVALRGAVDRIDRSPDGSRVVVVDYKTGSDRGYTELPRPGRRPAADITCRGRHLQLPLYAEAARQLVGEADDGTPPEVEAYFWFLDGGAEPALRGGPMGEAERARLREVLDVVVSGVEEGRFPANPGEEGWFGPANCGRCPYDRVCPPSRVARWERLRLSPGVGRYVELAEGPS